MTTEASAAGNRWAVRSTDGDWGFGWITGNGFLQLESWMEFPHAPCNFDLVGMVRTHSLSGLKRSSASILRCSSLDESSSRRPCLPIHAHHPPRLE